MSFIGLVTRKEKDTGVSLMAKVVTKNKTKSAKKIFKVKVKANALDDFSCCVIDHATAVNKINTAQDMNGLTNDVIFSYNGINGTTITYRIIDIVAPLLSDYLGEDGKITNRPKYGEGNAAGYVEITVSKNEASLTSRIAATVKSITAQEVLSDTTFTQAALWASIRGANDSYQQGSEWSGHNNISSPLTLIATKEVDTMSVEPVDIEWSVIDNTLTLASASGIYSEPRINESTGAVNRCSYKDACKMVDSIYGTSVKVIGSSSNSLQNRVRIGGLTLTAKLKLGAASKNIVFACSTISKYLTNEEVMEVVLANLTVFKEDGVKVPYKTTADASFETLVAPSTGGTYTLKAYGNRGSETFQSTELRLGAGDIIGVAITNEVLEFNGSTNYADTSLLTTAFGGGFQNADGDTYMKLVIDYDAIKDADSSKKKFACGAKISVAGYSANGITPGGSPLMNSRYSQFIIDTSGIVTTPVTPSP